jgi:glycosyltransferase involved in cell wall biosynthesis
LLSELTFGARAAAARWGSPDVVVLVSPALFSSCIAMLRVRILARRTPTVVWVQDLYSLGLTETGQGSGAVGRIMQAAEGWLLRKAHKVVVIHERFARRLTHDFGLDPARIEVVRNWTHLATAPDIDKASAREARGWGTETVVLHAGNMGVKQGLDNVIAAARIADERQEDVRFVLMGGGGERDRLRAAGADVERLEFLDPLPDDQFAQALAAADVLLVNEMPGVSEMAVPSKLTSYFSTGRPVLAATDDTGITAEEIRSAGAGILVPAGVPAALLDAAVELGRTPSRARALGANGKNYRETVLNETFAINRFANLLSLLINSGRDRPGARVTSVDP